MSMPSADAVTSALDALAGGHVLSERDTYAAIDQMVAGNATDTQIAAFLTATHERGESADMLAGAVRAVRDHAKPFAIPAELRPIVDTCGTGGDGAGTFNISTATAIVLAACGARVVKHGNRAASSKSGSADVLTALGVRIDPATDVLLDCLRETNITFLFAPAFHPALRHVGPVRRQLPFPTLFNYIGPLVNPARPDVQLMGLAADRLVELVAQTVSGPIDRPARIALVHSSDGLDEIGLAGTASVRQINANGSTERYTLSAVDFGLPASGIDALQATGPEDSARIIKQILSGSRGPCRDIVVANVALVLWKLLDRADSPRTAALMACDALDSGAASQLLERWATLSHS